MWVEMVEDYMLEKAGEGSSGSESGNRAGSDLVENGHLMGC